MPEAELVQGPIISGDQVSSMLRGVTGCRLRICYWSVIVQSLSSQYIFLVEPSNQRDLGQVMERKLVDVNFVAKKVSPMMCWHG
jgi:hypothetical protein